MVKIVFLGTTTLLFDDGKDQLLFDCHVTRPSLARCFLGRIQTDKKIADRVIREMNISRLSGIFISHSHHDHVLDAPYFALQCGADIYGSFSALNVARGGVLAEDRLHSYDDSRIYRIGDFGITIIPSIHSKAHWYNNDLGMIIGTPLKQPARRNDFKEGGSYDFLVSHNGRNYLIRPSYNYIEGQLDGIRADVVFAGISMLSRDTKERQEAFFYETIEKTHAETVIPIHWDNFFSPLYGNIKGLPLVADNTRASMRILSDLCSVHGVKFIVRQPLTAIEI